MNTHIIYLNEEGGIALMTPVMDCGLTIEQIAEKDVPTGKPYKFVSEADLPADFTFFNAWEADMTNPDGHGADYGVGSRNAVIGWNEDGTPITQEVSK